MQAADVATLDSASATQRAMTRLGHLLLEGAGIPCEVKVRQQERKEGWKGEWR